jgi:hypothetical protein
VPLCQVMQEEVVPGFAANGVTGFGDGMANSEVGMNLKTQVSIFDIALLLCPPVWFMYDT